MTIPLRRRLRDALPAAMKARDRTAVTVLRATLAALDNAEAVLAGTEHSGGSAIEQVPIGLGATEVERRTLTDEDVERILRDEVSERETAADEYQHAGREERAGQLRDEARVLIGYLSQP
jgi:uncharacterized protein YqeY